MIAHTDRGLLLGDGLFETVLAIDGEPVRLAAHLDRLAAGCAILGLPAPDRVEAERLMRKALAGLDAPRAAIRLTLTAGSGGRGLDRPAELTPAMFATAAASAPPAGPARLITSTVRRNDGSPASRLKTLSYLDNVLARAQAQAAGADEALMLNTKGEVACAAAANLFWITGGRLFTPDLECGVLAGIMRASVITGARGLGMEVVERRAQVEEVKDAEAVFITNSLIGLRAVSSLDETRFAPSDLIYPLVVAQSAHLT